MLQEKSFSLQKMFNALQTIGILPAQIVHHTFLSACRVESKVETDVLFCHFAVFYCKNSETVAKAHRNGFLYMLQTLRSEVYMLVVKETKISTIRFADRKSVV